MGQFPSAGGGDSGGAIYKDGTPFSLVLTGEQVTVPDGETWVVSIQGTSDNTLSIGEPGGTKGNVSDGGETFDAVLEAGSVVEEKTSNDKHLVSGWKL